MAGIPYAFIEVADATNYGFNNTIRGDVVFRAASNIHSLCFGTMSNTNPLLKLTTNTQVEVTGPMIFTGTKTGVGSALWQDGGVVFRRAHPSGTNGGEYYASRGGDTNTANHFVIHSDSSFANAGVNFMTNGGVSRMFINSINGRIGIGNTAPNAQLDVAGTINYTSFAFYFMAAANTTLSNGSQIVYSLSNTSYPHTTITAAGFRAPVKGIYNITCLINMDNGGLGTNWRAGVFRHSNLAVSNIPFNSYTAAAGAIALTSAENSNISLFNASMSATTYLESNDFIRVFCAPLSNNSTRTYTWPNTQTNYISGHLVCQLP